MHFQINFRKYAWILLLSGFSLVQGCSKGDDNTINIFSIEDDKALGEQLKEEIAANPDQYPLLDRSQYAVAYSHLDRIVNTILNSGKLNHKDDFVWEVNIVHDDNTLNAFAGPGGKIYVYTGIIKYLDNEDQLAGVLGHEIAHADRRHVTDEMTKEYGISMLLSIALGQDPGTLATIAANLAFLKFSRSAESEADKYSVIYLCPTDYKSDGAAGFFKKLIEAGQSGGTPVFLSTHPGEESRVQNITEQANELNCPGDELYAARYQEFKNSLP